LFLAPTRVCIAGGIATKFKEKEMVSAPQRLRIELKRLVQEPVPLCIALPLETDILTWRFVLQGPPETCYEGGVYQGKLVFPSQYPWKPPSVMMITPSGRFRTETRICLSISDFHPESWSPSWTVGTILTGIISFFNSEETTVGSLESTKQERIAFAAASRAFNAKDKVFMSLFPDIDECFREANEKIQAKTTKMKAGCSSSSSSSSPVATLSASSSAEEEPVGKMSPVEAEAEAAAAGGEGDMGVGGATTTSTEAPSVFAVMAATDMAAASGGV